MNKLFHQCQLKAIPCIEALDLGNSLNFTDNQSLEKMYQKFIRSAQVKQVCF